MYHLTCTSICCSQPFQPNKSSSGWQPYLKCRRAFDIIYISIHASLFCHATIQSSARNLAHASLETAELGTEGAARRRQWQWLCQNGQRQSSCWKVAYFCPVYGTQIGMLLLDVEQDSDTLWRMLVRVAMWKSMCDACEHCPLVMENWI